MENVGRTCLIKRENQSKDSNSEMNSAMTRSNFQNLWTEPRTQHSIISTMEAELWGSNHTEGKSHHHLNWRQIEGEARVAVPPLGAHARQPLPDPRRRPRHDLRCTDERARSSNSSSSSTKPWWASALPRATIRAWRQPNRRREVVLVVEYPKTSGGRRPLPRRARSRRAGGRRRMSPRSRPSTSPHKLLARAGRLSSRNPLPPPLPSSLPTRRDPRDCGDPWGRTDGGAPPTARSHGRIPRTQERKGKKREKEIAPLLIRQARAARRARRLLQLQELLRFARVRQLVWLPLPPRLASPRLAFRFGANKWTARVAAAAACFASIRRSLSSPLFFSFFFFLLFDLGHMRFNWEDGISVQRCRSAWFRPDVAD